MNKILLQSSNQQLWPVIDFAKERTMLADDTEKVLRSAEQYGLKLLISVARSSSMKPVSYSRHYPSIEYFKEIIPSGN